MRISRPLGLLIFLILLISSYIQPVTANPPHAVSAPAATDPEMIILEAIAQNMDCFVGPEVFKIDNSFFLGCEVSAGHSITIEIERFATETSAQTDFTAQRGDATLEDFHGYQAFQEEYNEGNDDFPMINRRHIWQADHWIFTAHAFDDTHFLEAPAPLSVSEEIYRSASARCLLSDAVCHRLYFPFMYRID